MANVGRMLGANIYALMQKTNTSLDSFEEKMGYSVKDVWNVIEGKVLIPPVELEKIANILGTTKKELMDFSADYAVPELQYMNNFSNPDHLDLILDLMDEYVECREAI